MKSYGANKATEFTKKQVSVIYRLAKEGKLKVEKTEMSEMYDMADYYGYDDNGSVEAYERKMLIILNKVFKNELEEAQKLIDQLTKSDYEASNRKAQENWNHELI